MLAQERSLTLPPSQRDEKATRSGKLMNFKGGRPKYKQASTCVPFIFATGADIAVLVPMDLAPKVS